MNTEVNNGLSELQNLGFTHLESEIYVHLLGAGASSGYAIAQAISKPAANVYKAINTLEKKGAILIDEGGTRLCHAVAAEELLNALQSNFETSKKQASQFLASIDMDQTNDKVFRLKKPEQIFEKCRNLLNHASKFVVIDAFLPALDTIQADIEAAQKRGVQVAIHSYDKTEIPGARAFSNPRGNDVQQRWKGQWLNLTVDSKSFIMAYFSVDLKQVDMAVWSNSPYISTVYHSALISELQLSELKHRISTTEDIEEMRTLMSEMEKYFAQSFLIDSNIRQPQ